MTSCALAEASPYSSGDSKISAAARLRAQALAALLRPKGAGPARAALGGDPLFERSPLSLIS